MPERSHTHTEQRVVRHDGPDARWEMVTRPPHPALRALVHRGYVGYAEWSARPLRRLEVPHEAITVIISLGPAIDVLGHGRRRSFVAGLSDRATRTQYDGVQHGIQVDLTPLGARMLLGFPMRDVAHDVVDLEAVLAAGLGDRLAELPAWEPRFAALDAFLLRRLADAREPRPDVAWAWRRLLETDGTLAVGALCAELGCSRRHLTARFGQEVGLPPKALARILRFRRVLRLLQGGGAARWADVATACGYYDQPHLNRDFRELAGCTPGEYVGRLLPDGGGVAG
jgi:AraC-like DNA-binding protein